MCVLLLCALSSAGQAPSAGQVPVPCGTGISASEPWADCTFNSTVFAPLPRTSVRFDTADAEMQALFTHAETCEAANTLQFAANFPVLVEGGHYNAVWLETQPMGGAMYAVRNLSLALHNQLVFMRTQRQDGRLAGMVTNKNTTNRSTTLPLGIIHPTYSYPGNRNRSMLQGFYMASPAVDVAWFMNLTLGTGSALDDCDGRGCLAPAAAAFAAELAPVLARFHAWLWSARNSSRGLLWLPGTADTGEDGSDKYRGFTPPFESMDMMGYAHDAARALARLAELRGDDEAVAKWDTAAAATAEALRAGLWHNETGACYDRERDGARARVNTLVHNNLRAMWHGIFSQPMADTFISRHLMNRSEFWTNTPLPSISVSDSHFQNIKGNDWSGPPEGLTFQRTIRALEQYGHHAELLMIGSALKHSLSASMRYPQQIDPFTSVPDGGSDCYGPMLLSMLEYSAMTTGIVVRPHLSALYWSSAGTSEGPSTAPAFTFTQVLGSNTYRLQGFGNGTFWGERNGRALFRCTGNTRVVTDVAGTVTSVVGVSAASAPEQVQLQLPAPTPTAGSLPRLLQLKVAVNEEWAIRGNAAPVRTRTVLFTAPYY